MRGMSLGKLLHARALLKKVNGGKQDVLQSVTDKNENLGIQAFNDSLNAVRTTKSVCKGTKRAAKATKTTVKVTAKTARVTARAAQRAAQAGIRMVKVLVTAIKALVTGIVQIVANPYGLLIVGIIALLILITVAVVGVFSAISANADLTEEQLQTYTQYIENLDNEFKLKVDEEEANALAGGYAEVKVVGRSFVNTNALQLIEILNVEFDEDLSITEEKLNRLAQYHALLYFYDIVYSSRQNEAGDDEPICTITVNAKSPSLILQSLGLSEDDMELIKIRWEELDGSIAATGSLLWPTPGYTTITSAYGYRTHPITGELYKFHSGIDIGAPMSADVVAADSGTVIFAGVYGGYGNYIQIDHGNGSVTCYGHNSELLVSAGDTVEQGQVIALVGSTGNSTGPHLHFEVMINGQYVDPADYF